MFFFDLCFFDVVRSIAPAVAPASASSFARWAFNSSSRPRTSSRVSSGQR